MRKKFCRFVLPALAMFSLFGMGAGAGVNQVQEVGLGVDNKADVKRAYSNSKNLVLPTSQGSFSTDLEPRSDYLGYAWATQGGLGTVSSSIITFASDISARYDSFATRIKSNVAIGYVAFRFATMDSDNSGSQRASFYYPSTTIPEAALGSSMFKVESGYYAIIEDISQWNSLEKFEGSLTRYKGNIGGGTFGIDYCFINKENTLIDGQTENLYYYVPNVPSMADILGCITAKDLFGADCTVTCSDSEKAKYNQKIGVSTVVINASDTYGQTATATLVIHVIDNGKPVVSIAEGKVLSFVANNSSLKKVDVSSYFSISDVGTGFGGTIGTPSFTYDGTAIVNDLTFTSANVGTHHIGVQVSDSSGNTADVSFALTVTDGTAPVIGRADGSAVEGVIKIGLSRTFALTKTDFLALFTATDNCDGDIHSKLAITGDFIPNKVGSYSVEIAVSDKAGNTTSKVIPIQVIADIPPVFILSDTLVQATTEQKLTTVDLCSVVQNGILCNSKVVGVDVDASAYVGNENRPGTYSISYSATVVSDTKSSLKKAYKEYNEVNGTFNLEVVNANANEVVEKHWYDGIVGFFKSIADWFVNGFHCLVNWFRGVFLKFKFDCFITNDEWNTRFSA